MPVDDATAKALLEQTGSFDSAPGQPLVINITTASDSTKAAEAGMKDNPEAKRVGTPKIGTAEYEAKRFAQGFWQQMERNMNAGVAMGYTPLPYSAMYAFLPKEWADKLNPSLSVAKAVMSPTPEQLANAVPDMTGEATKRLVGDIPEAPNAIAKFLGAGVEAMGGTAGLPAGGAGSLGKNLMMGFGAGEGGEVGGFAGKGVGKALGGTGETGEALGTLAGGILGGNLNTMRGNAMGKAGGAAGGVVSDIAAATKATWDAKRADDARGVAQIFFDNYGTLRADTKGVMEQVVNENVARLLAQDPAAQDSLLEFNKAIKAAGMSPEDTALFNIGQQVATPGLVKTVENYIPSDLQETAKILQRRTAQQQAIGAVYKRLLGEQAVTDTKTLEQSLEEMRREYLLANKGLDALVHEAKAGIATFTPAEFATQGQRVRDTFDALKKASLATFEARYAEVANFADSIGLSYDLSPALKQTQAMLKQTATQLDPTQVSPSIRNLAALIERSKGAKGVEVRDKDGILDLGKLFASKDAVPVTLGDLNEAITVLNDDISAAYRSGDATKVRNLLTIKKELDAAILSQSPPAVAETYFKIRADYATLHSPRFKEGINYQLDRTAPVSRAGEEMVRDEDIMAKYTAKDKNGNISPTAMKEFDNLFGGAIPGTQAVPQMYKELGTYMENGFTKQVLGKEKFSPEGAEKWMKENSEAIDRVPGLRDKLESRGDMIYQAQLEKEARAEQFREIAGGPLDQLVGPVQAKSLYTAAMSDPRKMGQLLAALNTDKKAVVKEIMQLADPFKRGPSGALEYDGKALLKLLSAGSGPNGEGPSSLQVAFRKAFGDKEGDAQIERLRAIATLQERQALTSGGSLRPSQTVGGMENPAGQSAASIISGVKSWVEGRTSGVWFGTQFGSRFLNAKVQVALEKAQAKALYDPDTAKAILELSQTLSTDSISKRTADSVWSSVGQFLSDLTNKGFIKTTSVRSGALALTEADEEKRRNREAQRTQLTEYLNRQAKH